MCNFDRTLWLTIFTYGQTFGVFVWILSNDRPLYLSLGYARPTVDLNARMGVKVFFYFHIE